MPGSEEKAVLFVDPTFGYGVVDFDSGVEVSSQIIPIEGQNASCWSACSSRINRCYIIAANSNQVTESSFTQNEGGTSSQIVGQYAVPGSLIDSRIASLPNTEFLYVLSPSLSGVQVLSLNGPGDTELVYSVPLADDVMQKCGVTLSNGIQGMAVHVI